MSSWDISEIKPRHGAWREDIASRLFEPRCKSTNHIFIVDALQVLVWVKLVLKLPIELVVGVGDDCHEVVSYERLAGS